MRDPPERSVIDSLRTIRLSRMQVGIVALLSAAATGLIIAGALGHTPAQKAALAALQHRPTLVRFTSPSGGGSNQGSSASDTSTLSSTPPAAVTPSTGTTGNTGAASGSTGNTGAAGNTGNTGNTGSTTTTTTSQTTTQTTTTAPTHKIHHVFLITLTTPSYTDAFSTTSVAKYLNHTLVPAGTLLSGYETLGLTALPDELALLSGQAPNADTRGECATYSEFPGSAKPASNGQVPGDGCVYPNTIITLADQVASAGKTWKGYIEDMGSQPCIHPNSDAVDNVVLPFAGAQYATRHNPFIYFHSLLDLGGCASNDVTLTKLTKDLGKASTTPTLSYLAPRACDDAGTTSCPDGKPAGVAGEDAFLKTWVPKILASPAYKQDGLLVITFAIAGAPTTTGGGAPTGTLLLSRYAARGKTVSASYDPYSVLASIESLFGFDRLVHARGAATFLSTALPNG